jgi:heat shock protein HtpX
MAFAKRIFLFLAVNFLVVSVISFIIYVFNIQPFLTRHGLDYGSLALFCLIWGMGGAFISLLLSKMMAKWLMGVQIIDPNTRNPTLRNLVAMVHNQAQKAGLPGLPEVGIYESAEINAFATGPSKSHSLVAVSTGLLQRMTPDEVEGVLGHEVSHIANGDMVTMTLLQGVVNAFVMFMARVIAFGISRAFSKNRDEDSSENVSPLFFQLTVFALEMVFMTLGMLVIARFSQYREFRADAGGARLAGSHKMIEALKALQRTIETPLEAAQQPAAFNALKISSKSGMLRLFATHPPLEERIERLEKLYGTRC